MTTEAVKFAYAYSGSRTGASRVGHFRVPKNLTFKVRLSAKPLIFQYDANKTHFHNKGFAPSLALKVRFFGILFRSWYTLLTLHEVDTPFQSADQLTGLFDGSSTSPSTCFLELLSPRIWPR